VFGDFFELWELIGGPEIGLRREFVSTVRLHSNDDEQGPVPW
jgi:hypothetical protein